MSAWNGVGADGGDSAGESADAEPGQFVRGGEGPQGEDPADIDLLRRVLLALGGTLPPPRPPKS